MLIKIANAPVNYAWGSKTLLSDAFGFESSGEPMAEVWFGTHPLSEAHTADAAKTELSVVAGHRLNFMLKFLAAGFPLSIQVHPSAAAAAEGFEQEEALGLELSHPHRSFKDPQAKREAIVGLTEFDLLAGLKSAGEIGEVLDWLERMSPSNEELVEHYRVLSRNGEEAPTLIREILGSGDQAKLLLIGELIEKAQTASDERLALVKLLSDQFGSDVGILVALLMKRFLLRPGQAVFVEVGVPHCYLNGLGLEILNSSDNVLRGGLTSKHVSPEKFVSLLDAEEAESVSMQTASEIANGLWRYNFATDDFILHRVSVGSNNLLADFGIPGKSILVCTAGELAVSNSLDERVVLTAGEAAYLANDAKFYSISGSGDGYLGSQLV